MGIGLGVFLIVVGLIFALGVVEIPGLDQYVATEALGWILFAGGVLSIILALFVFGPRRRAVVDDGRPVVEERREY